MKGTLSRKWSNNTLCTLLLILLALLGVLFVSLSTRWGAGPSLDSASYTAIARNLVSGQGYRGLYGKPAVIWPPLYPLFLAFIGLFGPDPLIVTRWANAAIFGGNVLLVGLILRRYVRFRWIAVLGSLLVLTSVDLLHVHSMIWTEPLFIFLGLLGLLLIAEYAERQRLGLLLASAAIIALAVLTRYAGVSLIITAILIILFFTKRALSKKLRDALLFAGIACLPLALWIIRNVIVAGTSTGRTVRLHSISLHHFRNGLDTFSLWLLPEWVPLNVRAIALIVIVVAMLLSILILGRKTRKHEAVAPTRCPAKLPWVLGTFIACYLALILLSLALIVGMFAMYVDFRILAPLYPPALILVLFLGDRLLRHTQRIRTITIAAVLLAVVFAVWHANRSFWWIRMAHKDGLASIRTALRESYLIKQVTTLDPEVPVFTNAGHVVYFCADRLSFPIPGKIKRGQPNEEYTAELAAMKERLENENGIIVYFNHVKSRFLPSRQELEKALPLRIRTRASDGVIYEYAQ